MRIYNLPGKACECNFHCQAIRNDDDMNSSEVMMTFGMTGDIVGASFCNILMRNEYERNCSFRSLARVVKQQARCGATRGSAFTDNLARLIESFVL
jgi:hypothetical protein